MSRLLQSTARSKVVFMTDSADHVSGKTGLTLTITASKDGGSFASISPTVTELANGWYKLALTSSHTDTVGDLALHITATGADPTDVVWEVESKDLFSALTGDAYARLGAPAGASVSADIAAVQSDTNDIQSRLPAALVGGRIDASVGAMAANVITAASIAADAITDAKVAADVTIASVTGSVGSVTSGVTVANGGIVSASFAAGAIDSAAVAASAVTEIQSGLALEATLNTVAGYIDTEVASILAAVDTEVAAIKAKTDSLTFTVAGSVDANIQQINDVTITGNGQAGTEFNV